ncbi:hypothetical protein D917_01144 [Trichinella nativa]|uniref:protein-serine/threonine phosphatase n=1 Tax=Trichinella nativa TaxID=6335 RepID=A0A1Y3EXX8_9BILA|nr:hypothetical protein D917_01144 [Trichinella nativa]
MPFDSLFYEKLPEMLTEAEVRMLQNSLLSIRLSPPGTRIEFKKDELIRLIGNAIRIFKSQPMLLELKAPINSLKRPMPFLDFGLCCDLLWSDPEPGLKGWAENTRGVSFTFGEDVVKDYIEKFDIDLIVRAHQVMTVFTAPNYCSESYNSGAILVVDEILQCHFEILRPHESAKPEYKRK